MKTGYFYALRQNEIGGAVSIAVGKPRYVKIQYELKSLAPTWGLLNAFRKDEITEDEYVVRFNAQLLRLDPYTVVEELEAMTKEAEPVMMCHCGAKHFCHRHLVAEWLEKETGQVVEEFGMGAVRRINGRIV